MNEGEPASAKKLTDVEILPYYYIHFLRAELPSSLFILITCRLAISLFYNNSPRAANAPSATPPTVESLLIDAAAPVETLDAAAEAVSAAPVAVAVAELEIEELTTPAGTSSAFKVPQTGHFWEPGLSRRHCSKVATQMELGTEPMYASMLAGAVPFLQTQSYLGISL